MRRPGTGFTLIELLLVIAIISLLIALIMPGARIIREQANRARCAAKLRGLATAYMAYVSEIGRFPPVWHVSEYRGWKNGRDTYATWFPTTHTYCVFVEHQRWDVGFGPLAFKRMVRDSSIFVCPILENAEIPWFHEDVIRGGVYLNFHETNPDPADLFEQWNTTVGHRLPVYGSYASYSIRPGLYPYGLGELQKRGIYALMADNCHYPDVVLERHVSGVNVAFFDGSVSYCDPPIVIDNAYITGGYYPLGNNALEKTEYYRIWQAFDSFR